MLQWSLLDIGGSTFADLIMDGVLVIIWSTSDCDVLVLLVGSLIRVTSEFEVTKSDNFLPSMVDGLALRSPMIINRELVSYKDVSISCKLSQKLTS
jgi:hypothetical protein